MTLANAMISDTSTYLDTLNPEQRQAVETTEGPLLVLAGAGTGKTRVLTTRLAHLLLTGRARAGEILCTTFTNKAAREMKERVGRILGHSADGVWLGTFHALCTRILRRHAELMALDPQFIIIDADDQTRLVKQIMAAQNIDDKKFPARAFLGIIQSWKDKGLPPEKVQADHNNGPALAIYTAYQQRLRASNAVDFGDLILYNLQLFAAHPDVLQEYSARFRYILVDEYQDTNIAQYLWLRMLALAHKNICCVGDDDQSIYGWRGAEVGHILKFEQDFPGAGVIRLERNYRSTEHILGAASGLIAHNKGRLGKTLWTGDKGGDKVTVAAHWDDAAEARYVGEEVETLQRAKQSLKEQAILVRASFQTRAFEERFMTLGVPYRVIGGLRFYERQEIRDALGYLRVVAQPDDDLALTRIINLPKRGIGKSTLDALTQSAREQQISLYQSIRRALEAKTLKPKMAETLQKFLDDFARWRKLLEDTAPEAVVEKIIEESGYRAMWQDTKTPDAPGRVENLKELVRAIGEFPSLTEFLEHVGLVTDTENTENDDMVNIMTLHAAKGLEFDHVFLPGWEEGLFPHQRALDEGGTKGLEEERRLAYVGLTRARKRAWVSYASNRRIYGQYQNSLPSRFIGELPPEHIEKPVGAGGMSSQGWKAAVEEVYRQANQQRPAAPAPVREKLTATHPNFPVGTKIFHQKFGYGKVITAQGDHLQICFEKAGIKKLLADFVTKA
ncbi:MAG: UvrD-helicase domain-containing protein [Alphaproteobacteria bacterium]|nr:UvrD-helicase domain-containing protein [Alphaproteobacteria bacterium]